MTPKEKASELFDKFYFAKDKDGYHPMNQFIAKQCAIIAVDEMLNMWINIHSDFIKMYMIKGKVEETATYEFLNKVKKELENL